MVEQHVSDEKYNLLYLINIKYDETCNQISNENNCSRFSDISGALSYLIDAHNNYQLCFPIKNYNEGKYVLYASIYEIIKNNKDYLEF